MYDTFSTGMGVDDCRDLNLALHAINMHFTEKALELYACWCGESFNGPEAYIKFSPGARLGALIRLCDHFEEHGGMVAHAIESGIPDGITDP